eukprot:11213796-Alexandrium_andersonii.AAC.1
MAWSRVTPLAKKGSTAARPKVRPLEAADSVRKMAVGLLIEQDKRDIADAFRPHQFAVGVQSGAEALAKAAQALADSAGFAIARLDGKSAFNSQDRATALDRLGQVSPALANAMAQFYS